MTHAEKWQNRQPYVRKMFAAAANGNISAYSFLLTLFEAVSMIDDLYDKDVESADNALAVQFQLVASLFGNPFVRAHGEALAALITASAVQWDISNSLAGADGYATRIAQAVFYVAMACNDRAAARSVIEQWIKDERR